MRAFTSGAAATLASASCTRAREMARSQRSLVRASSFSRLRPYSASSTVRALR